MKVSQTFAVFGDLDSLEEYWSGIVLNAPHLGFVWYFLVIGIGLGVRGGRPQRCSASSPHPIRVRDLRRGWLGAWRRCWSAAALEGPLPRSTLRRPLLLGGTLGRSVELPCMGAPSLCLHPSVYVSVDSGVFVFVKIQCCFTLLLNLFLIWSLEALSFGSCAPLRFPPSSLSPFLSQHLHASQHYKVLQAPSLHPGPLSRQPGGRCVLCTHVYNHC